MDDRVYKNDSDQDFIRTFPETPGNYPKDLIQYFGKEGTAKFPQPLKDTQGIILALDIRDFTSMMEEMAETEMNEFLSEFFERASSVIQDHPSGYINKFLGDGLLAHFIDFDPHDIIELAFDIRSEFFVARSKSRFPFIGLTQIIALNNYYIGAVGKLNYFDYTLIGKSINRVFRMLGDGQGDCIYVSDKLLNKVNDTYLVLNGGIKIFKGVSKPIISHAVFRKKSEDEINNRTIYECSPSCAYFKYCKNTWRRGKAGESYIDCHTCQIYDEHQNILQTSLCEYWNRCKKKHQRGEKDEDQTCCQSCHNFNNCYHNFLAGSEQKPMVDCLLLR